MVFKWYLTATFTRKAKVKYPDSYVSSRDESIQISAVFERFTERAIKDVIFSQREAKSLGKDMVFTQHLLLGLIVEDRDPNGFWGSGLKTENSREAVKSIWQSSDLDSGNKEQQGSIVSSTDVPFSISTKWVFEAAVEYSRTIGLLTVDDGSASRVLKRLGADVNHLAAAAVTRLQGELVRPKGKHKGSSYHFRKEKARRSTSSGSEDNESYTFEDTEQSSSKQ